MPTDFLFAALGTSWADRLELLKIGLAVVAFSIGWCQYHKAQVWKRVEFVAAEMTRFFDDEAAKEAMTMLDWRRKRMTLYKYRDANDLEKETVTYAIVARSLGTDPKLNYDKIQSAIREVFERFLLFLARFEGFVRTGVVEENDLTPYLDYWLKLLAGNDENSPEVTHQVLPQLWDFIHFYGYKDVARFVERYEGSLRPEFKPRRVL